MLFVPIQEIFKESHSGKKVAIRGWIYRKRETKRIIFLILRDSTGIIQCTVKPESKGWNEARKAGIESSVCVEGNVGQDDRAPGGVELSAERLSVIGLAERFPITKSISDARTEEFIRDVRHLWLRSRRMNSIMKVRSEILKFTHEFFRDNNFIEVSPPMFITSACEGGSTLFGLKYFDREIYLTQSAQMYLEALIFSLGKVYCVAPSFRAEKSRTIRHLTEYWHIEAELPFADLGDLMSLEERYLSHICIRVAENCKDELEQINADISKLSSIKSPFPKITYERAVDKLNALGFSISLGEDLGFNEEKALADKFGKPFFIYDYPRQSRAFYCKTYRDRPKIVMSTDMLVPGIGEISTGGVREDDKEKLVERIREQGLKAEDYDWYIDLRRYGTVPHVGFGMGLERLVEWVLDLENIVDAIPFPRTIRRVVP